MKKTLSRNGETWTKEELNYLQDKWGVSSRRNIAKRLKRSETAVQLKAQRLGLGDPLTHIDGITISALSKVLKIHYNIVANWRDKYGLPARQVVVVNTPVWAIKYEDFWKWAEKNKHMIDFSRVERLSLGPEPEWVHEKRKADQITKLRVPKPHNTPWSKDDDAKLIWMLRRFKYTYPEIAYELNRTQGAVKRRIRDLGLKERPVRLPNHNKYTKEDEKILAEMLEKGYCFEEIANRLNRSALGVRGKAERMGYKFKNGVPYFEEKIG